MFEMVMARAAAIACGYEDATLFRRLGCEKEAPVGQFCCLKATPLDTGVFLLA
jgi:hypothetical protein